MAFNDIWVDTSTGGGHERIYEGTLGAAATFFKGEPVMIDATAGTVLECATDPTANLIAGIALNGPGDAAAPYAGLNVDWETGNAAATGFGSGATREGMKIKVLIPGPNTFFLTQNYAATGTTFNGVLPALTQIGDITSSLCLTSGSWGVRGSGGTNAIVTIVDILDPLMRPIRKTDSPYLTLTLGANGKPQYWIRFQIGNHQFNRTP